MSCKFIIKSMHIPATWAHDVPTSICAICRCNINIPSLTRQDKNQSSNIVIGRCQHSYHEDCINKWIESSNKHCPLCIQEWIKIKTIIV